MKATRSAIADLPGCRNQADARCRRKPHDGEGRCTPIQSERNPLERLRRRPAHQVLFNRQIQEIFALSLETAPQGT
jgi:hypothetical protein